MGPYGPILTQLPNGHFGIVDEPTIEGPLQR
jgi:hypothetical protein